jgi:hypothetical protein
MTATAKTPIHDAPDSITGIVLVGLWSGNKVNVQYDRDEWNCEVDKHYNGETLCLVKIDRATKIPKIRA